MTKVDEKSWKKPAVGDTLTLADGRIWTVTAVEPRSRYSPPGDDRISYDFTDAAGHQRKASPMRSEWDARIGRLIREGAVYEPATATASPVARVIAAARDMLNLGEHDGPCAWDETSGKCPAHIDALEGRVAALESALAAYDEAQS